MSKISTYSSSSLFKGILFVLYKTSNTKIYFFIAYIEAVLDFGLCISEIFYHYFVLVLYLEQLVLGISPMQLSNKPPI